LPSKKKVDQTIKREKRQVQGRGGRRGAGVPLKVRGSGKTTVLGSQRKEIEGCSVGTSLKKARGRGEEVR